MALLAWARYRMVGDHGIELAFEALNILNEEEYKPQVRSSTTVEIMIREYSNLEDLPPTGVEKDVSPLDRARLIICLLFGIAHRRQ